MIGASAATWLSYATTLVFQILFAARFGSSPEAGGFVVAFAVAVSVAGVFITTATTIVMPKLVDPEGGLASSALRALVIAMLAVVGAACAIAAMSLIAVDAAAELVRLPPLAARTVLLLAAALVALFGLAGVTGTVALARGRRFVPAAAPAFPSTMAAGYLALTSSPSVTGLFSALVLGATFQLAVVAAVAWLPRVRAVPGPRLKVGSQALQMLSVLVALSLIPPVQRVLAGSLDLAGVARFDYATRSIQAAQQLLIGGLLVSRLPDWSRLSHDMAQLRTNVAATAAIAALILSSAGSVALVAAPDLTVLIFERGAFSANDSAAVGQLIRVMSLGFIAEGVSLILVQGFFAASRADLVIRIGFMRVALQISLTVVLGVIAGAAGVATAYTVTMVVVTMVTVFAASGTVIGTHHRLLAAKSGLSTLTIACAGIVAMIAGDALGTGIGLLIVMLTTIGAATWLGLGCVASMLRKKQAPGG